MLSQYTTALLATIFLGTDALVVDKRNWGPALPSHKALWDTVNKGCLHDYADDGQLFSQGPTWEPNKFTLSKASWDPTYYVLTDENTKNGAKICVGSEAGGNANQFQCSNDPDNAPGANEAESTGQLFSDQDGYLTYNGNKGFFGCGTLSTGINYYVVRLLLRYHDRARLTPLGQDFAELTKRWRFRKLQGRRAHVCGPKLVQR